LPRPRSFDDTEAIEAALASFWGRGYEATSVRDLSAAMGISGPSLYNAFGDKHALFCAALEHYCRTRTYPLIARMEASHPGAAAVPAFFAEIIARSTADRERRGCFLINSALETAPHDAAVAQAVRGHLAAIRGFLLRGLKARAGTSRAAAGSERDADHLLAVLLGLRVLARTTPDRPLLMRIAHCGLRATGFTPSQLRALGPRQGRGKRSN
jgi:TetR/AcrR family transcriptional repressor of nem operon